MINDLRQLAGIPFARMNGVGNVIVVLDLRGRDVVLTSADVRAIATAPGMTFDQLMVIHDPTDQNSDEPGAEASDAYVRIYNTDGSLSGACGNGSRCVACFMMQGRQGDTLNLTTSNTRLACRRLGPTRFSVDMGQPSFRWDQIPLRDGNVDHSMLDLQRPDLGHAFALGMGNPHAVFFVADTDALDLAVVGPSIEHAALFPERVNVSFAQVVDPATIKLRVWERGAGATLGCGTGACATLVAAASTGRTGRRANVDLPGGRLEICWRDDDHVIMTGPVELETEGTLDSDLLADRAA